MDVRAQFPEDTDGDTITMSSDKEPISSANESVSMSTQSEPTSPRINHMYYIYCNGYLTLQMNSFEVLKEVFSRMNLNGEKTSNFNKTL